RLTEDVVTGLPLDDRQRQYPFGIEESVPQPALGAGRTAAVAIVDDTHAAARGRVAAQRRIDELCDQRDQRRAHVAHRQKQRPPREPARAGGQAGAGEADGAGEGGPPLGAVGLDELATLVRGLDLAQLAGRDIAIEDIEAVVVGEEQRGTAAGPRRREGTAAAA